MIAWSESVLSYEHAPLLDAIAAASISRISAFGTSDIANTAWSFATLECSNPPFLDSIASASRPLRGEFGAQEVVLLSDAGFTAPTFPELQPRLRELAASAAAALLRGQGATERWLHEARVDRLGWSGTQMLQELLAVSWPCPDSRERAATYVAQLLAARSSVDASSRTSSADVVAFARVVVPAMGLDATAVRGFGGAGECEAAGRGALRALRLPLSRWVDRTRCSEFQALEALCNSLLENEQRKGVVGSLDLWVFGAPPCLSCVSVLQQVRHLLPNLELRVGFSRSLSDSPFQMDLSSSEA